MSRNTITFSQACEGLVRYKQATGKSEHTISDYRVSFKKLAIFFPSDPFFNRYKKADDRFLIRSLFHMRLEIPGHRDP